MNIFLLKLSMLFRPSYWLMNHPYSKEWEEKLWELMSKHDFKKIDRFNAKLGDQYIWIANHPYGSFCPYEHSSLSTENIRPRRTTIYLAHKKYIYDTLNKKAGEQEA